MKNTAETPEVSPEQKFKDWLDQFLSYLEQSGYAEPLDEKALHAQYFESEDSPYTAACGFLRSKGL